MATTRVNPEAEPWRISPEDCLTGKGRAVPDLVWPNLRVLFVGINPSNCSGAAGFHFATPRNRFWPVLYQAGFTDRQLRPDETDVLRTLGIGISNLVNRATRRADEVELAELKAGADRLRQLVPSLKPAAVAILGLSAYRAAFDTRSAVIGRQPAGLGATPVWVLPNPSGLNTHFTTAQLAAAFAELRRSLP